MADYTNLPGWLTADLFSGKITNKMFNVMVWLFYRANFKTGVVKRVSADRIRAEQWADDREADRPSERTVQECLWRLDKCGYISSAHVQGQRGSYSVTIKNYPAVMIDDKGAVSYKVIHPTETIDWHDLPKQRCGDKAPDLCPEASGDASGDASGEASAYTTVVSAVVPTVVTPVVSGASKQASKLTPQAPSEPSVGVLPSEGKAGEAAEPQGWSHDELWQEQNPESVTHITNILSSEFKSGEVSWEDTLAVMKGLAGTIDPESKNAVPYLESLLHYAFDHPFWKTRILTIKSLAKALRNVGETGLMAQYERAQDKAERKPVGKKKYAYQRRPCSWDRGQDDPPRSAAPSQGEYCFGCQTEHIKGAKCPPTPAMQEHGFEVKSFVPEDDEDSFGGAVAANGRGF